MNTMHTQKVNRQRFVDINHNKEYLSDKGAKKQLKQMKKCSNDKRKLVFEDDKVSKSFD